MMFIGSWLSSTAHLLKKRGPSCSKLAVPTDINVEKSNIIYEIKGHWDGFRMTKNGENGRTWQTSP